MNFCQLNYKFTCFNYNFCERTTNKEFQKGTFTTNVCCVQLVVESLGGDLSFSVLSDCNYLAINELLTKSYSH